MKTIIVLLVITSLLFTNYSFAQESTEDTVENLSLINYDYKIDKADYPVIKDSRATFGTSIKYRSLQEFINSHIQFPDDARFIGISGSVIAQFEILGDGSVGEIYFVQSPDQLLSKEVERVLRMAPKFIPAVKDGRITSSYEQIKIHFTLQ